MKNTIVLLFITVYCLSSVQATTYPDIREVFNSQINNAEINVPFGTYLLDLKNNQWEYIFGGKKDIVIEGNGSTIICNRQTQALLFRGCSHVTFRNFIIDYDPPCSTQGTITEISNSNRTWTVEIHDGYPTEEFGFDRVQAYGKDTQELIPNFGTANIHNNQYTKLGERTFRFTIEGWNNNPVRVGDFVVLNALSKSSRAHTIVLESCKFMKFENITVYDSNAFSFLEYDGEANHYYRCVATRKTNDPRYPNRLRAGVADAFHSRYAKVGPTVEECTFNYTGDDCIAINGVFYPVCSVYEKDPSISILASVGVSDVRVKTGDSLICVANNGTIRGAAKVTRVREFIPTSAEQQATFSKLGQVLHSSGYTRGIRITLDSFIEGTDVGDVIYSKDRTGNGFKILRNTVGHNRSRAILVKASDGIIEGNTIKNSAMSAIALAPEFYWMEAGCPSNVIIRNNTITNCMYESSMWNIYQFAAIIVVAEAPNGGIAPAGTLNNIAIYDNKIIDCPKPCIGVTSTNGLRIYGNEIRPSSWVRQHGGNLGIPNRYEIFRTATTNVVEEPDATSMPAQKANPNQLLVANNRVFVSGLPAGGDARLEISDLVGKKVSSQSFSLASGASIEHLQKGMFIAVVYCNNMVIPGKIMNN